MYMTIPTKASETTKVSLVLALPPPLPIARPRAIPADTTGTTR